MAQHTQAATYHQLTEQIPRRHSRAGGNPKQISKSIDKTSPATNIRQWIPACAGMTAFLYYADL
ncbi:hypothetical protein [Conchiformibius kuhniae]|uniref:Uncharacterized protein n=1 Tax=Conchiformibius kuhniae TaxID=211502 RepID=A0A8T9MUR5_9NEIS|nr:hypothetical protein [Conchiformibius kuhniae]UOP04951.1 hypothetical protein LVJ77_00960 [Conchiformibius kuhniae]